MTLGVLPSIMATQELVVPRSIPMMGPLPAELKHLRSGLFRNLSMISNDLLIELKLTSTSILYFSYNL
jgi:hypothetical protein